MIGTGEVRLNSQSKRKFRQYVEVTGSPDNGQSIYVDEVTQLKKRLANLEEETNTMKQEMFRNRAERKALLDDVYRQLKLIQFSLHPENQTLKYNFCKMQDEGRLDGLSQVLYEDWNPSVVIRGGSRAYSVADSGPVESTMPNILCIEYHN